MIIIRGDTNGRFDDVSRFCREAGTTRDDVFIILGDAGINYLGGVYDHVKKQVITDIPVTLFCNHGNHECRPENIPSYHLIDFRGGKAYVEDEFQNIVFAKMQRSMIWREEKPW